MRSGIIIAFVIPLLLSVTSALPSSSRISSHLSGSINTLTLIKNATIPPNPLPQHSIACFDFPNPERLVPSDCLRAVNQLIIQQPNFFTQRRFIGDCYKTDAGGFARARWWHNNCQVSVEGYAGRSQMLSFSDVVLTANKVVALCGLGKSQPVGGVGLIGDPVEGFAVRVSGLRRAVQAVSARDVGTSRGSAAGVSRRAMRSREDSAHVGGPLGIEPRDPPRGVSRVSNRPLVTLNSNLSEPLPQTYPINCFDPSIIPLPAAVPTDCGYIIHQTILRLFEPTRELTFGFTDAADINLSKLKYRRWRHGQCTISVQNLNEAQVDTFRLVDVAETARRISTQCLILTREMVGGVAGIGTEGKGFHVYVSGRLDSGLELSDVMLLGGGGGVESL